MSDIDEASGFLGSNTHVLVFAGSGLSAESGIPTFRGEDGLYDDPEVASYTRVDTFQKKPKEVLSWYQKRREMLGDVEPNPGHYALARISRKVDQFNVSTQNVDNLLERGMEAEDGSGDIYHLHGELALVECFECGEGFRDVELDLSEQPDCDACGGALRPGVVWFGEALPQHAFAASQEAAEAADVCLLLGTSGAVYPAARIPVVAERNGATLIEVNPNETELSDICTLRIRGKTGDVLPKIEERI